MVRSPFPEYIGFAVMTAETCRYTLTPAEAHILGPRAIPKRVDEFTRGRAACHAALEQIGITDSPPILKGAYGEPIWPAGVIGAVTHAAGIAIAAVSYTDRAAGIGVDLEKTRPDLPYDAYDLVCTGGERAWIGEDRGRFACLFSAKEAAYKAFFPHVRSYLDFHDAELTWRADGFTGVLLIPIGATYPVGYRFEVGVGDLGDMVFSHILLPV